VAKKKAAEPSVVTIGEDRMSYLQLADYLKVSLRTLKRWVVTGMVPQPVLICNRGQWSGERLSLAKQGAKIPGTFDYEPNEREQKRTATIARKAAVKKKAATIRRKRARGKQKALLSTVIHPTAEELGDAPRPHRRRTSPATRTEGTSDDGA